VIERLAGFRDSARRPRAGSSLKGEQMKRYEVDKIRNVALVGHGGSGKTSLGEALLFTAGATKRLSRVDEGNSVLDFEAEEKSHKLTFSTSVASFEYKKHKITLLDTPGYDVFLYDGLASMVAAEAAVLVAGADSPVKFEAEKIWARADELGMPRAAVVTKLDKENTDFAKTVENLHAVFGARFVPLQVPMGAHASFKGIIDLMRMKAVAFDDTGKGAEGPVPADLADEAKAARDAMVECLVETDDALMEKFFEGAEITSEELSGALRKGFLAGQFVPVLAAVGPKAYGASLLLDLLADAFPSPADRKPVPAQAADGSPAEVGSAEDGPLAALVFKTISDPFAGRLNLVRVFRGKMNPDSNYYNATRDSEERVGQIAALFGKDIAAMTLAGPGDIFAVPKLKETHSGDTFCDRKTVVKIPLSPPPEPFVTYAVYPKAKGDEDKMGQGLRRMQDEDITFRLGREEQTHELLVSGMGRLHIDILLERMKRKYGADVELKLPKVPYRETIKGSTKVQGRHKKQTGGRGQFADTWIEIRPLPRGTGFKFVDKIVGGAIPRQFIPAVEAGVRDRMGKGVIAGYPIVDVEVALFDGKYHDVDSSEMAFKIAGSVGFKKGILECKPVLLEPIHEITVRVPEEHLGDIIGDLNSRRGRVLGMEPGDRWQIVRALVPLAEVQEYAPDLRSKTSGRGTFTMKFDHYDEVPPQLAEKIIAGAQLEEEEE
jgi:elongation factor G